LVSTSVLCKRFGITSWGFVHDRKRCYLAGRNARGNSAMPNAAESPLATYIAHLKRGELGYQFSPSAQQVVFYPRVIAPKTGAADLEWRVSKGIGTVHATTVVHPQQGAKYNVCLVDVDEGFRMMSRVENIDPTAVRIGMRVKFRVHTPEGDEDPYPVFTPLEVA
jgi:uncharacterized OB-fold protein